MKQYTKKVINGLTMSTFYGGGVAIFYAGKSNGLLIDPKGLSSQISEAIRRECN
jgi:hypothetical protein